jgi:hypothetical protein
MVQNRAANPRRMERRHPNKYGRNGNAAAKRHASELKGDIAMAKADFAEFAGFAGLFSAQTLSYFCAVHTQVSRAGWRDGITPKNRRNPRELRNHEAFLARYAGLTARIFGPLNKEVFFAQEVLVPRRQRNLKVHVDMNLTAKVQHCPFHFCLSSDHVD